MLFEHRTARESLRGEGLLADCKRALVDLVRGATRVRYLLKPCACGEEAVGGRVADASALPGRPAARPAAAPAAAAAAAVPAIAPTGPPAFVYRIAAPDASDARARFLATGVFGFSAPSFETPTTHTVHEGSTLRTLVLYKPSGAFDFVDARKYRNGAYAPTLPDRAAAVDLARAFLL